MLPNFKLPFEIAPGDRRSLLARDLPACVFWFGFPELGPVLTMRTFLAQIDAWERGVLARAVIKPVVSAEQIGHWGGHRRRLPLQAYLEAVGFRPRTEDALLEFDDAIEGPSHAAADAAYLGWVPRGPLRQLLAATAQAAHLSAAAVWRGPISDMLFTCRVAMADELLDRMVTATAAPVASPAAGVKDNVIPFPGSSPRVIDVRDPLSVIGVERG